MFAVLIFPLMCPLCPRHPLSGYTQPKQFCQLCRWRRREWGFKNSLSTRPPLLQLSPAAVPPCQSSEEECNPTAPSPLLLYCSRSDKQQPRRIPSAGGITIFALRWQQHPELYPCMFSLWSWPYTALPARGTTSWWRQKQPYLSELLPL